MFEVYKKKKRLFLIIIDLDQVADIPLLIILYHNILAMNTNIYS